MGKSRPRHSHERRAWKLDSCSDACNKDIVSPFRTRDLCQFWALVAMSCESSTPRLHGGSYRVDADAIVIGEVFAKKTTATPRSVIEVCKRRFEEYDDA